MIVKIKFVLPTTVFAAFCLSNVALADDHESGKWFAEGRYNISLSEKTSWSDADTTTSKLASTTGASWSSRDGMGLALGYQYADGLSAFSVGWETLGTSNLKFATGTLASGTVVSNYNLPVKTTNIMLEYSRNFPITDTLFAVGVLGVGMATVKTEKYTFTGNTGAGTPKEVTNTSTRFGLGLGYNLNEDTQIISVVQQSNYGDAEIKAGSSSSSLFAAKVSGVEASIRLRVMF
ncbi:hypothetical protein N9E28_02405 [Alphaproteobacteria bacterium]|nr:hypothetical protein [Alphaproteobacteria bacterium]